MVTSSGSAGSCSRDTGAKLGTTKNEVMACRRWGGSGVARGELEAAGGGWERQVRRALRGAADSNRRACKQSRSLAEAHPQQPRRRSGCKRATGVRLSWGSGPAPPALSSSLGNVVCDQQAGGAVAQCAHLLRAAQHIESMPACRTCAMTTVHLNPTTTGLGRLFVHDALIYSLSEI